MRIARLIAWTFSNCAIEKDTVSFCHPSSIKYLAYLKYPIHGYSGLPITRKQAQLSEQGGFSKNPNKRAGFDKSKQGGKMDIFSTEMIASRDEFLEI